MITPQEQISILAMLSKADQVVAEQEYRLILFIANRLGMEEEEAKQLFDNPKPIPSFKNIPTEDKVEFLYDIVKMMKIDGKVHAKEVKFCEKLAMKLGYRPGVIADFSQFIYSDPDMGTNKNLLWEIAEKNIIPYHQRNSNN